MSSPATAQTTTSQAASAPAQTHRSSSGSTNTCTNTMPANSTAPQDPLAALERDLLARPTTRHYHRHHPHHQHHEHNHLTPPTPTLSSGSRKPSPSPSPAARRCMAATAAWTPSLDRRQSWDGQEYRRAMMVQATGLVCRCHPGSEHEGQDHHHEQHAGGTPWSSYEADRGFSEVAGAAQHA